MKYLQFLDFLLPQICIHRLSNMHSLSHGLKCPLQRGCNAQKNVTTGNTGRDQNSVLCVLVNTLWTLHVPSCFLISMYSLNLCLICCSSS